MFGGSGGSYYRFSSVLVHQQSESTAKSKANGTSGRSLTSMKLFVCIYVSTVRMQANQFFRTLKFILRYTTTQTSHIQDKQLTFEQNSDFCCTLICLFSFSSFQGQVFLQTPQPTIIIELSSQALEVTERVLSMHYAQKPAFLNFGKSRKTQISELDFI